MSRRIGILTGGGDCPGLNNAIKWVVKTAARYNEKLPPDRRFEVIGFRDGWAGPINYSSKYPVLPAGQDFFGGHHARILDEMVVRSWDRQGGTCIGSSRTNPFAKGSDLWMEVVRSYRELDLYCLIALGGDDTQSVTWKLHEKGLNVLTIPKTIDGDLAGTEYTLGFDTAVNVIVEEVDRLRSTAASHGRIMVVEAMGRHAGHLALAGGAAAGADVVLIPEVPFKPERVAELVKARMGGGARYCVVVAAEGALIEGKGHVSKEADGKDEFGHVLLGGVGRYLEEYLTQALGADVRSVILSHLQRGGVPSSWDRRAGRLFGIAAMDLVVEGRFGMMASMKDGRIAAGPIPAAEKNMVLVDAARAYDADRYQPALTVLRDLK
jgi:6-phosphofructokinase 1